MRRSNDGSPEAFAQLVLEILSLAQRTKTRFRLNEQTNVKVMKNARALSRELFPFILGMPIRIT
jgi:hypothetical protein